MIKRKKQKFSQGELKGFGRNYGSMSAKTKKRYTDSPCVIIMATVTVQIIKAKLGFTRNMADGDYAIKAKAIYDAIKNDVSGYYTTPAFSYLAQLLSEIDDFNAAIAAVEQRVLGAEGVKKTAKKALQVTLNRAVLYINGLCLDNPLISEAIITGAKMEMYTVRSINKQDFAVKQGFATGEVRLTSLAAKLDGKPLTAWYEWQFSIDNGATWVTLPHTMLAKTIVTGLTVRVSTLFRKRVTTFEGTSAWCTPIEITVV